MAVRGATARRLLTGSVVRDAPSVPPSAHLCGRLQVVHHCGHHIGRIGGLPVVQRALALRLLLLSLLWLLLAQGPDEEWARRRRTRTYNYALLMGRGVAWRRQAAPRRPLPPQRRRICSIAGTDGSSGILCCCGAYSFVGGRLMIGNVLLMLLLGGAGHRAGRFLFVDDPLGAGCHLLRLLS